MTKENQSKENKEEKTSSHWSAYFQLGDVTSYFGRLFGKKDPNAPSNFNIRMMHGINKISIVIFLIAVIVMVTRAILRS